MATTPRTLGAALLALLLLLTPGGDIDTDHVSPQSHLVVHFTWPDHVAQLSLTATALERFEAAGLDLPPLEIRFHAQKAGCDGHLGLFTSRPGRRVDVCWQTRHVLLHELAHAWTDAHLGEEKKLAYVGFRGLESWNDPEGPWRLQGSEDAAIVIANLLAFPLAEDAAHGQLTDRLDAYRFLTGMSPPASLPDCGSQDEVPVRTSHRRGGRSRSSLPGRSG